jgi:hypothetical protein
MRMREVPFVSPAARAHRGERRPPRSGHPDRPPVLVHFLLRDALAAGKEALPQCHLHDRPNEQFHFVLADDRRAQEPEVPRDIRDR